MGGDWLQLLFSNGMQYIVHFIEDYSKFVWTYFTNHKCQIFENFLKFKLIAETQFNTQIT